MSPITVALLRHPDRLVAVTSRRVLPFAVPRCGTAGGADPYVEEFSSLSDAHMGRRHSVTPNAGHGVPGPQNRDCLRELSNAWERLGRVAEFDDRTIDDIATALKMTTPADVEPCVAPWRAPLEARTPRPTAAHPRAYRGTKSQPPTPAQPPPADLRPYLCNARDSAEIVRHLGDRIDQEAARRLEGYALPPAFRSAFGMLLILEPDQTRRALGVYWDLGLNDNEPLRRCVARLFSTAWLHLGFPWCEAIMGLEPERRVPTLEVVLECSRIVPPSADAIEILQELSRRSSDVQFQNRVWAFANALRYDRSPAGLMRGVELANAYREDFDFADVTFDEACQTEPIIEWVEHIRIDTANGWTRESSALELWTACGGLPGFAGLLEARLWNGLDPDAAFESLQPFLDCLLADDADESRSRFRILLRQADDYFRHIRELQPPYRLKGIRIYRELAWELGGSNSNESVGRAIALMLAVCREPLATDCTPEVFQPLVGLGGDHFQQLLACELKSFRAVEEATRSRNDAGLITRGLTTLVTAEPAWLVSALRRCPKTVMRAAKTLGCLGTAPRQHAVATWRRHPLLRDKIEELDLRALALCIDEHRPADVHDPLPRKIREFASHGRQLTESQIQRALIKVREQLFDTRADLLRRLALGQLVRSVGSEAAVSGNKSAEHAVHLQNLTQENRRGLRKFLRAYLAGRHDYLESHPANQRWLAAHPAVDATRWQAGMALETKLSGDRFLTLAIETNPLEALRLGTYVGSCLGLGGWFAASAAAVVLDVNKTVVYARDQRGRVVARQMIAISEDDQLVCFHVYPVGASAEIRQCFSGFDEAFAAHLDLRIHLPDPDEAEPSIANPLANYWWDDGAWDGEVDRDASERSLKEGGR